MPDLQRFSNPPTAQRHSLKPLHVATWSGLVFINLGPSPMPLETFLGPLIAELEPYQLGAMKLVRGQSCELEANWETVLDNFGEVYHVDFLHPQHASFVDCRDAAVQQRKRELGRGLGFDYAGLNDDEIRLKHFHDWHAQWMQSSREPLND